jgi:hypothetical protein
MPLMTSRFDIPGRRLRNQMLLGSRLRRPEGVVAWFGAVQAQDYPGSRWGVGQRIAGATDVEIERAFDAGRILRTHVMRPTWHLVLPSDIRWMLAVTAPRVHAVNAAHYRRTELDGRTLARGAAAIVRALEGGTHLTRTDLKAVLQAAGIPADGQRLAYLMMHAELEGIICSGPRRGRQFTYALLDERVPPAPALSLDEALAELARRYFSSHGPATVHDFAWWSGLTIRQASAGARMAGSALASREVDDRVYWFASAHDEANGPSRRRLPIVHLLPNFDEYFVAYRHREAVLGGSPAPRAAAAEFPHYLVINGTLRGNWKRLPSGRAVRILVRPFATLANDDERALDAAVARYGAFVNTPVAWSAS